MAVGRRWEPSYRQLYFQRETRQVILAKRKEAQAKPLSVDIRTVQECVTLYHRTVLMKINDKWRRDRDLAALDPTKVLVIYHGSSFVLHYLLFLFEVGLLALKTDLKY